MHFKTNLLCIMILLATLACSTTSSLESSDSESAQIFPEGLAVSSPTEGSGTTSSGLLALASEAEVLDADAEVARLLAATDISDCATDLDIPSDSVVGAECFGPSVIYENHPDLEDSENSGTLPTGDLGIWTESEGASEEACAAAELNAHIEITKQRVDIARISLASMVCVINNSTTITLVDGDTVDISTELANVVDSETIGIQSATVSYSVTDGLAEYGYDLGLDITDVATATTHTLVTSMQHQLLDSTGDTFAGIMNYQLDDTVDSGNCPGDVTIAGSVQYSKDADANFAIRSDDAVFCMAGDSPFTDTGALDASYKYDGVTAGGWGDNYNIFVGNFVEGETAGSFSYVWQAGSLDDNSRIFNIVLADDGTDITGDAYFGFGEDVESTDGSILGFICDWAVGSGSTHEIQDYVQHQSLLLTNGVFVADTSEIGFAPTLSCTYSADDETDGTIFTYDLDGDGEISADETTEVSAGIANALLGSDEMNFTVPEMP